MNYKNTLDYCPICLLYKKICICGIIEKISLKTKITLVAYQKELLRLTNTGRLVSLCLLNQKIIEKDRRDVPYNPEEIITEDHINLLLYPMATQELTVNFVKDQTKPINLIIPDGTWRQTRKIFKSEKLLHSIIWVKLPDENPMINFLRKPQKEYYFSTFDAISRALRIIENEEVYHKLKSVLDEMVKRLLKQNGKITTEVK